MKKQIFFLLMLSMFIVSGSSLAMTSQITSNFSKESSVSSPIEFLGSIEDGEVIEVKRGKEVASTSKITFTTSKAVGEKINIRLNAASADQSNVWIDLNGNNTEDSGEKVTNFSNHVEYTLGSQTITIYGKVTKLWCFSISLISLDLSKNTNLTSVSCNSNSLSSLDVSKNTNLTFLSCSSNNISNLALSKNTNLTFLSCSSNNISTLDLSKNTNLTSVSCNSNSLNSLDVSKNTNLKKLSCSHNNINTLDVSKNINLEILFCSYNNISILDLSKNSNLTTLSCSSININTLDLSKNTNLTALWCRSNNSLSTLDLSKNTNLSYLQCNKNKLTVLNIANGNNENFKHYFPISTDAVDISNNPNLTCIKVDEGFNPPTTGKDRWLKDDIAEWRNDGTDCPEIDGINELSGGQISIYPNPSDGVFNVNVVGQYEMQIIEVSGKVIDNKEISGNSTVSLPTGVYFLKFSNGKATSFTQKVIVR